VITRADDGGEDELVAPFGGRHQLGVAQLDQDVVARQDVGHVHLEHVGPLLLEQRAGLAFALGGLVLDARALLLLDLRVQHAAGQAHLHRMHRSAGRAGEDVARLDGALAFVAVALRDGHVGNHAGDARRPASISAAAGRSPGRRRRAGSGPSAAQPESSAKAGDQATDIAKAQRANSTHTTTRPVRDSGASGWRSKGNTGPRTRRISASPEGVPHSMAARTSGWKAPAKPVRSDPALCEVGVKSPAAQCTGSP
jgi:hypothetical protein